MEIGQLSNLSPKSWRWKPPFRHLISYPFRVFSPSMLCPATTSLVAAWSLCCHPPLPFALVLNAFPFGKLISSHSHALVLISSPLMTSAGSFTFSHPLSFPGSGSLDSLSPLLQIISGVREGSYSSVPWQAPPFIRIVVKERVVHATLFPCFCNSLSVSPSSDSFGSWEISMAVACRCTGWIEGDGGTLACGRNGLNKFFVLGACSSALSCSAPPMQVQLARMLAEAGDMAQHGGIAGLMDIEKKPRRPHEMLSISAMDNIEMAKVVNKMEDTVHTSLQFSNHESRFDDNENNTREILGKGDRMQGDLQKFIFMNQSSRVHEDQDEVGTPMEEASVFQPKSLVLFSALFNVFLSFSL